MDRVPHLVKRTDHKATASQPATSADHQSACQPYITTHSPRPQIFAPANISIQNRALCRHFLNHVCGAKTNLNIKFSFISFPHSALNVVSRFFGSPCPACSSIHCMCRRKTSRLWPSAHSLPSRRVV